jgi:thiol-disulfide isomerase/thioredoxin
MKATQITKIIIRLLLGAFFIITAILKLLTVEQFELYIYSFDIMNFVLATVAARAIITFEFLLGTFLILKCFYKQVWYLTMITLIGFTFFLIYAAIFRNDANCHCMGDLVVMKPLPSIIKNLISIALLIFIKNQTEIKFRFKKLVIVLLVAVAIIVPFIVFPMDVLYNKMFTKEEELINTKAFEEYKQDSIFQTAFMVQLDSTVYQNKVDSGNYLIGFISSGCKYCKVGNAKLHQLVSCNNIDKTKIKFVIFGDSTSTEIFKKETETSDYQYVIMKHDADDFYKFLGITNGSFPKYLYLENGKITKAITAQGFNEDELKTKLQ